MRSVELAVTGDHCAVCARLLNINEPLYRTPGGKMLCAACNDACDASTTAASVTAFVVKLTALPTSELLRMVAVDLESSAIPGALRDRATALAAELRVRALSLRGIGEVRS